jgi:hypothetical protein
MAKFVENFLFGLAFGMGFVISQAVLAFVAALIAKGAH